VLRVVDLESALASTVESGSIIIVPALVTLTSPLQMYLS